MLIPVGGSADDARPTGLHNSMWLGTINLLRYVPPRPRAINGCGGGLPQFPCS